MIFIKAISDADAQSAIEAKEFPDSIRASKDRVAVILTQGWCHQWVSLKREIERIAPHEKSDIDVHVFVYDQSPLFDDFLAFKETVFGNNLIPYVRYYRDGRYRADSNYVGGKEFLELFS